MGHVYFETVDVARARVRDVAASSPMQSVGCNQSGKNSSQRVARNLKPSDRSRLNALDEPHDERYIANALRRAILFPPVVNESPAYAH